MDMAVLSIIPVGDPDLATYLSELLRISNPEQQNNTYWFPTPKNQDKTEKNTPIQTLVFKEMYELERKEKLNPEDDPESRTEFLERFDWIDTLLTEAETQAIEVVLIEYYNFFARHSIDSGMNTEFKMKITPKTDKVAYGRNLPMQKTQLLSKL